MGKLRTLPWFDDAGQREWANDIHTIVNRLGLSDIPPGRPANLTVTPLPGANRITFTAGDGADHHILLISASPVWDPTKQGSHLVDLGQSTTYTDYIGIAAKKMYYWITAHRGNQKTDPPTGPVGGTTLTLTTNGTIPAFVPLTQDTSRSYETGKPALHEPRVGGRRELS